MVDGAGRFAGFEATGGGNIEGFWASIKQSKTLEDGQENGALPRQFVEGKKGCDVNEKEGVDVCQTYEGCAGAGCKGRG